MRLHSWILKRRRRLTLCLSLMATFLSYTAYGATITVTTTFDPGTSSDCDLRSAISAAVSQTPVNGCAQGDGNDSIIFKAGVTGTILLASDLPRVNRGTLAITGPDGSPGITVDGTKVETIFQVQFPGILTLNKLKIVNATDSAIINNDGNLTVEQCLLSNNKGKTSGGGAIFASGGEGTTTTVSNSTFFENSSTLPGIDEVGGGAILVSSPPDNPGSLIITGSTFNRNSSAMDGGAILSLDGIVNIVNSTFAQNVAQNEGGALWDTESLVAITNTTFSGNTTRTGKGGGAVRNFASEDLSLKSTIVAGKAAGGNCSGTITDAGYNISDDGSCGFSATSRNNTDPKLNAAGLADNGGPTPTIALTFGSPAVDAIPLDSCTDQATPTPKPIKTDQRGVNRPDPEDIGNPACDIGAYELVECTGAFPSVPAIFPPNGKFVSETVMGVTDVTITGIFQDEPAGRNSCPDGRGIGTALAAVRARRDGRRVGRTYHIRFSAFDSSISSACLGEVKVCVPHDRAHPNCIDSGPLYDSTICGR
jgi:hypothetical protein